MRILVIGSGGREHALVWKLAQSTQVSGLYSVPGNPGIAEMAKCVEIDIFDNSALLEFAKKEQIDLTVVGPEAVLANGIVDCFSKNGLKIFGPSQAAARLESSKTFAKDLMQKYKIPTAKFAVFDDAVKAKQYVEEQGAPIVIKADGLAAGKGVVVAATVEEAKAAIDMMLLDSAFGYAGSHVVIEEFMTGEEASVLAFTDGYTIVPMVAAQDHKRVFDGDAGPNTGGMGTYAPAPVITGPLMEQTVKQILQPVIDAMRQEGCLYKGCLYAGLMITVDGPKVVEFNARFGDPETQVLMPLLENDLVTVFEACIDGRLESLSINWHPKAAVCVVMAAGGYPASYSKGDIISGLEQLAKTKAIAFHAGTALDNGRFVTNGGRVLGITAIGEDLEDAIANAYTAVDKISFANCHFRKDIGFKALGGNFKR